MERKWWTLIAVCIGTFMLLLDVTIVNVALPALQTSLKASFSDLQWVVDACALMLAALLLTTGSLADLFGRRRVFVIGLIIFSLSSLLSGLASSPLWLNLARGAQGVGGAAMFSTSLALLGSAFQGRERGTAFGARGALTGLAVRSGPWSAGR
jgi:MFS family permease